MIKVSKIARDISERKRALEMELLVNERRHRVKNTLAMVQAIATQTFRNTPVEERESFIARVQALAQAHNLLTNESCGRVSIEDVVERASAVHGAKPSPHQPLRARSHSVLE